ncbi:MAG: hypothetical protein ACRELF_17270, partial [Gemmataceae bacterium]
AYLLRGKRGRIPSEVTVMPAASSPNDPKRSRPNWILVAGGCAVLFCCAGGMGMIGGIAWLIRSEMKSGTEVRGSYPPATSTYQGATAAFYARQLNDTDRSTFRDGVSGLQNLGKEGIPYLLNGILRFQQTGQDEQMDACLLFCNPSLVEADDLPIFVKLLDNKRSRMGALGFFVRQDGAGKKYLGTLQKYRDDPDLQFAWAVRSTLHKIDPQSEADPGLSPQDAAKKAQEAEAAAKREAARQKVKRRVQERGNTLPGGGPRRR